METAANVNGLSLPKHITSLLFTHVSVVLLFTSVVVIVYVISVNTLDSDLQYKELDKRMSTEENFFFFFIYDGR